MKYCANYNLAKKDLNRFDEVNIFYDKTDVNVLDLVKNEEKKFNFIISKEDQNDETLMRFSGIKGMYPNFKFSLVINAESDKFIEGCVRASVPFYFAEPAASWSGLTAFVMKGVSEVLLIDEMCFQINDVKQSLEESGIKIRLIPNYPQQNSYHRPSIKSFFVRPEDLYLYEDKVDVIEFYVPFSIQGSDKRIAYLDTIYQAYVIDKLWFGKLKEIVDINSDIDNRAITEIFGAIRVNCGKRCMKGKCNICGALEDFSATLVKNNIAIFKKEN